MYKIIVAIFLIFLTAPGMKSPKPGISLAHQERRIQSPYCDTEIELLDHHLFQEYQIGDAANNEHTGTIKARKAKKKARFDMISFPCECNRFFRTIAALKSHQKAKGWRGCPLRIGIKSTSSTNSSTQEQSHNQSQLPKPTCIIRLSRRPPETAAFDALAQQATLLDALTPSLENILLDFPELLIDELLPENLPM